MITVLFTGCGLLDKLGFGGDKGDELNPVSSVTMGEDQANNLKDKSPVQLYFINEQGTKLMAETRYINLADTQKGNEVLATAILKELISGPAKGSLLKASIPKGTTVKSPVSIKNGIATVDLSKEFVDKHPGGKKQEQLTLYSIVNSLTEISDIKSVQFKIDGKIRKDYKGAYQIDIAYPRSAYLISAQPQDNKDSEKKTSEKAKEDTKDNSKTTPQKNTDTPKQSTTNNKTDSNNDVETNVEILE
jgi:hypothetical protein